VRNAYNESVRKPEGTEHYGDTGTDMRIILKWI
jgi:hypothetical protein